LWRTAWESCSTLKFFFRKTFDNMLWFLIIILDNFVLVINSNKISLFFYRKWPVKMTDKARIWPTDNSAFWPDIVRWPAVISRPVACWYTHSFDFIRILFVRIPRLKSAISEDYSKNIRMLGFVMQVRIYTF
jgi:hypothetical protein